MVSSQEPKRPGRIAGSLGHPFPNNAVAYLWKEKSFLKKVAGDLFHWGDTPLIALDYHQVLHIDRGVKPPVEVDEFGNLPPRHIQTVKHLRSVIEELKADVKIVIVSHTRVIFTERAEFAHSSAAIFATGGSRYCDKAENWKPGEVGCFKSFDNISIHSRRRQSFDPSRNPGSASNRPSDSKAKTKSNP